MSCSHTKLLRVQHSSSSRLSCCLVAEWKGNRVKNNNYGENQGVSNPWRLVHPIERRRKAEQKKSRTQQKKREQLVSVAYHKIIRIIMCNWHCDYENSVVITMNLPTQNNVFWVKQTNEETLRIAQMFNCGAELFAFCKWGKYNRWIAVSKKTRYVTSQADSDFTDWRADKWRWLGERRMR